MFFTNSKDKKEEVQRYKQWINVFQSLCTSDKLISARENIRQYNLNNDLIISLDTSKAQVVISDINRTTFLTLSIENKGKDGSIVIKLESNSYNCLDEIISASNANIEKVLADKKSMTDDNNIVIAYDNAINLFNHVKEVVEQNIKQLEVLEKIKPILELMAYLTPEDLERIMNTIGLNNIKDPDKFRKYMINARERKIEELNKLGVRSATGKVSSVEIDYAGVLDEINQNLEVLGDGLRYIDYDIYSNFINNYISENESKYKMKSNGNSNFLSGVQPEPFDEPVSEPIPGPQAEPVAGPMSGPIPGPQPEPVAGPMPGPIPGPQPEPVAGPMPGPIPGPQAEPIAGPMPGPTPGPMPRPAAGPMPGPIPGPQPRPVAGPIPEPQPEPIARPIPEPQPQPVAEPIPEPQLEPVVEPMAEPVPEPQPEPVVESIPEPVSEPQPEEVVNDDTKLKTTKNVKSESKSVQKQKSKTKNKKNISKDKQDINDINFDQPLEDLIENLQDFSDDELEENLKEVRERNINRQQLLKRAKLIAKIKEAQLESKRIDDMFKEAQDSINEDKD